jgi:hypothetical protein
MRAPPFLLQLVLSCSAWIPVRLGVPRLKVAANRNGMIQMMNAAKSFKLQKRERSTIDEFEPLFCSKRLKNQKTKVCLGFRTVYGFSQKRGTHPTDPSASRTWAAAAQTRHPYLYVLVNKSTWQFPQVAQNSLIMFAVLAKFHELRCFLSPSLPSLIHSQYPLLLRVSFSTLPPRLPFLPQVH